MIELTLSDGQRLNLAAAPAKKFKGLRLPGANLLQYREGGLTVYVHEYDHLLFRYSVRTISSELAARVTVTDSSRYLRLEAVINGEATIYEEGKSPSRFAAGQYRISRSNRFQASFSATTGCTFFVAYLSDELLRQSQHYTAIQPTSLVPMPAPMHRVIQKILDNPYEASLREVYYDHSVRELLFCHLSALTLPLPGEMTAAEIAAVYEADNIIAADLSVHHSIEKLARLVKTNSHVLKTGFSRVFGMGVFERLLQRKMERARMLLETTDKQIQQIAMLAGYDTVTGFITAFRKQFKMTPKDWRRKSRGTANERR